MFQGCFQSTFDAIFFFVSSAPNNIEGGHYFDNGPMKMLVHLFPKQQVIYALIDRIFKWMPTMGSFFH